MTSDMILLILLRWIHVVAGITWIGLLYFFNLVNVNFLKSLDPAAKTVVIPKLMPPALAWFRWSALVSAAAGLIMLHFLAAGRGMFSSSWGIFIFTGGLLGLVMLFNVWVIIWPNQKQVIRMTIESAKKKQPAPKTMAIHARRAYLASRTNFYLSFPMLFCMGAAAHLPLS